MNDKNNLAQLMVSGDKANHKMAAIMLTNYTAVEFLRMLHEMTKLYIANMPPNISFASGGLFLTPNLRVKFSMDNFLFLDLCFAVRKKEATSEVWSDIASFVCDIFSFTYNQFDIQQANQVLEYLQQHYKQNEP